MQKKRVSGTASDFFERKTPVPVKPAQEGLGRMDRRRYRQREVFFGLLLRSSLRLWQFLS